MARIGEGGGLRTFFADSSGAAGCNLRDSRGRPGEMAGPGATLRVSTGIIVLALSATVHPVGENRHRRKCLLLKRMTILGASQGHVFRIMARSWSRDLIL
jgi:hypothetical protein